MSYITFENIILSGLVIKENNEQETFTKWGSRFFISFFIKMENFNFDDRRNIIHLTDNGKDQAVPAVYVDGAIKSLVIQNLFATVKTFYYSLELEQEYRIIITQDKYGENEFKI